MSPFFDVELWNRLFQLNLPVQKGKERDEENTKFYIALYYLDMDILLEYLES